MTDAGFPSISEPPLLQNGLSDQQVFDLVFTEVFTALRKKASMMRRLRQSPSLTTSDLVNSLFLRLRSNPKLAEQVKLKGKAYLMAVASKALRNILVDAARRKRSGKGGGEFAFVTLSHAQEVSHSKDLTPELLLDLEKALCALEQMNPRQAKIVEMRFYGGLTIPEVHASLGLADATIERDISAALKWLAFVLKQPGLRSEE